MTKTTTGSTTYPYV